MVCLDGSSLLAEDVMYAAKLSGLLAAQLRLSPLEAAGLVATLVQLIRCNNCKIELGLLR